jgi:CheY-like chemotaxis protein
MGYAELCREKLPVDHPVREWVGEITKEAVRSANLTRQLLAFARKQTVAPQVLDLNDTVGNMLKMLRRLIGEDIDLSWQPGAELWSVKIDPGQVDQILANLCVNARDAIGGAGRISIETNNVTIHADYCAEHIEAAAGSYVMLAVSDDGCGMDRETLNKVFEPFFTTKPTGEGTGLGLATVYGIIKQNNGFINVYSEPGKGTTFRIHLPRDTRVSHDVAEAAKKTASLNGTETILLVEDETAIRTIMCLILEKLGYTVIPAESPAEALRLAEAHRDGIDLMITDVVMSGRELVEKLAPDFPSMKILYMSGYTADVIAHRGVLDEGVHFLGKPVGREELAQKVRDVLG